SDGSLAPRELIGYACRKKAAALALTDHDTLEGLEEALQAGKESRLEVIPGLEISAEYSRGTMHILGYYIDRTHSGLNEDLNILQEARKNRNPRIIGKLQALGFPVAYEEIDSQVTGQIGRPHIAKLLLKKGHVSSLDEAFQKYLAKGAPAYVDKFRFPPDKAIDMIHQAGGIAVLAHPFSLNCPSLKDLYDLVKELKDCGLQGMEVLYPKHSEEQTRDYFSLVKELKLLYTGGSDFHGNNKENTDLLTGRGDLRVPYSIVEDLKSSRAGRQTVQ
ncbi:MAG TPA: PHP domain-containing protein, partial [Thermodesulfobacteriota bacterium]|nr:PHP domain-containing protein [Thermodesulfobacteriota bacterium]